MHHCALQPISTSLAHILPILFLPVSILPPPLGSYPCLYLAYSYNPFPATLRHGLASLLPLAALPKNLKKKTSILACARASNQLGDPRGRDSRSACTFNARCSGVVPRRGGVDGEGRQRRRCSHFTSHTLRAGASETLGRTRGEELGRAGAALRF